MPLSGYELHVLPELRKSVEAMDITHPNYIMARNFIWLLNIIDRLQLETENPHELTEFVFTQLKETP